MAQQRIHVIVSGRVQGVFFRGCTQDAAQRLNLTGWVQNKPTGSVEAEIQGDESEIERMVPWLHKGSPMSIVNEVIVTHKELVEQEDRFVVRY